MLSQPGYRDTVGYSWHISRSSVIPQPHEPKKWWLFVNLSYPAGLASMMAVTLLFVFFYINAQKSRRLQLQLGKGAVLAKADIEAANWTDSGTAPRMIITC